MGLGEENEPPKKKLKQAQLCFTPKSQKRKLVSDSDDDVQFVKIIRKEAKDENLIINDKENQLSLNKSFPLESDKIKTNKESIETDDLKKKKEIDLNLVETEANSFTSPQDVKTPTSKNTSDILSNTPDFSLSISDSVFDDINNKSTSEDQVESTNEPGESSVTPEKENTDNNVSLANDENKETPEDLNESLDDSELNDTLKSDDGNDVTSSNEETTPNKSNKLSLTPKGRKLTPKQLESIKKKEELQKLKLERRAQLAKQKEEKLKKLEEEKLKKKEAKEKKRLEEQKVKDEEKKAKDEERRKRDEEKKQKEEKKEGKRKEKEEEKRKREEIEEKKKAAFAKFFKKSTHPADVCEKPEDQEQNNFMPFPTKPDMRLASQIRRLLKLEDKELLDSYLVNTNGSESESYLIELKTKKHIPLKTEATWSLQEEEHDVIIIESTTNENSSDVEDNTNSKKDSSNKSMKAKLLQFHDNRRPPYWGTWRKKSSSINPRRPLGQDKVVFDYEVDSESEWEDEGEGEDIDKERESDGEGSGEEEETPTGENGYLLDNTFVPHGYLSDEEVHPDDETEENEEPEDQKNRMKLLKQEFDEEMKTKTERLKPRLLGCVWISNGTTEVSSGSLYEGLLAYRAVWAEEVGTIDITGPVVEDSPSSTPQTKKVFPKNVLTSLVKFVHGCSLPLSAIIKEFLLLIEKEHPSEHVSKRAVTLKVKEIASKTYDYSTGKPTWTIIPSLLEEFGLKPVNAINSAPPLPSVLPVQVPEKPKEGPLMNFLKGTSTPPVKKRVPFVTLPKSSFDYTPSKMNERGSVIDFGTPRPVDPVLRKRAQLITLSTSVGNRGDKDKIAPSTETENSVKNGDDKESTSNSTEIELVDLCTDSQ